MSGPPSLGRAARRATFEVTRYLTKKQNYWFRKYYKLENICPFHYENLFDTQRNRNRYDFSFVSPSLLLRVFVSTLGFLPTDCLQSSDQDEAAVRNVRLRSLALQAGHQRGSRGSFFAPVWAQRELVFAVGSKFEHELCLLWPLPWRPIPTHAEPSTLPQLISHPPSRNERQTCLSITLTAASLPRLRLGAYSAPPPLPKTMTPPRRMVAPAQAPTQAETRAETTPQR